MNIRDAKPRRLSYLIGCSLFLVGSAASVLTGVPAICAPKTSATPVPGPAYAVTDLGALPGSDNSAARGINAIGDVTGYCSLDNGTGPAQAFLLHRGRMTDLGALPPEGRSIGNGLNDRGDVVGNGEPGSRFAHAFLYHAGKLVDLGALGGDLSHGYGVNNRGDVVGDAEVAAQRPAHAFLFRAGKMTDLGALLPGAPNSALAINDAGDVTGRTRDAGGYGRAFLYRGGKMTLLGPEFGYPELVGNGINASGQIAGSSVGIDRASHAFFYDGQIHVLESLPGFERSFGLALNDSGQVVGYVQDPAGFGQNLRACLWDHGKAIDLNGQIAAGEGWSLREARGINGRGQIIGDGLHHGKARGFLLTPMKLTAMGHPR